MTIVPLTQATSRLGIDAKTLRRWLAEAQISLQNHPVDGRKKGVSEEHLEVLARLHHRHLAACEQAEATHLLGSITTLPDALLALPEQLATIQADLVTLQQQVAALTRLLTQPKPQPTQKLASVNASSTAKPKAQPARSAAAAKAKVPAKPVHVIARVEYSQDGHYVVICPKKGLLPLEPDTEQWFAWVKEQSSFRFVGRSGHFTAHHEWTTPRGAWRAHRQIRNHSYTLRLAPNEQLTLAVLEQAAQALQAHLT